MLESLFRTIIEISVASSFVIIVLLLISPFVKKLYAAKWRYIIWLILAVRLIVPFNITLPSPPVELSMPKNTTAFRQPDIPTVNLQPQITGNEPQIQTPISTEQNLTYSLWEVLTVVWLLGVAAFLLRLAVVYFSFRKKMKRQSDPVTDDKIISMFDRLCSELHIKRKPGLSLCKNACSPMMYGFTRPVLFLSTGDFDIYDLEVILRHELIHYKRRDLWYKFILLLANAVHWFNPLVYMMVKSAQGDIEFSCDDEVIKSSDMAFRKRYSQAILHSMNKERCQNVVLSTQFRGGKKVMKNRFDNILNVAKKRRGIVALCVIAILVITGGAFVACQKIGESELEKNLKLLKAGDTKSLVGFETGDPVDLARLEVTEEYRGGGQIHRLKSGNYQDIFLFFEYKAERGFSGLGAEMTGNFFGITIGETNLETVTDILGPPDVYNEISDMWDSPEAIYYFEKNTLYLNTDSEYRIKRITYKAQINDRFAEEVPSEDEFSDFKTFWGNFRESILSKNNDEIKKYVHFPLKTRGAYDDDPVIDFEEDRFSEVFAVFLEQDDGVGLGDNFQYIERNEILKCIGTAEYNNAESYIELALVDGNWARTGDMHFEKEGERWLLTFIYINTENYRKLNLNAEGVIQKTESPTETQQSILYENVRLGFSVEFPADWEGLFEIAENYVEYDWRGGSGITVYQKASRDISPDMGEIFYIERWIGTWTDEEPPINVGSSAVVFRSGKYTYMLRTPSDVRYIEDDEAISTEYKKIFDRLDDIKVNVMENVYASMYTGDSAENEFLDSADGKQLREIAFKAARAMLKADIDELAKYLINPGDASRTLRNMSDTYDDLAWLCFKFVLEGIVSENEVRLSYEYAPVGKDSFGYVDMMLKKVNGEWKIDWIWFDA